MAEGIDTAALGHTIAAAIRERLIARLDEVGPAQEPPAGADPKAAHAIDEHAAEVAAEALAEHRCNIYIEGHAAHIHPQARLACYLDPVDGSMNWDRRIGDPAFVMAWCQGPEANTLDDLEAAYVEGLVSGDCYWAQQGRASYHCGLTRRTMALGRQPSLALEQATGYLRFGYGGAAAQLAATGGLLLAARDVRAVDNAAIEFCEIARGAAGFMVEARGLSDGYNLLAWPIVRAAGGALLDPVGAALAQRRFVAERVQDYVIASSPGLAHAVVEHMRASADGGRRAVEALHKAW